MLLLAAVVMTSATSVTSVRQHLRLVAVATSVPLGPPKLLPLLQLRQAGVTVAVLMPTCSVWLSCKTHHCS